MGENVAGETPNLAAGPAGEAGTSSAGSENTGNGAAQSSLSDEVEQLRTFNTQKTEALRQERAKTKQLKELNAQAEAEMQQMKEAMEAAQFEPTSTDPQMAELEKMVHNMVSKSMSPIMKQLEAVGPKVEQATQTAEQTKASQDAAAKQEILRQYEAETKNRGFDPADMELRSIISGILHAHTDAETGNCKITISEAMDKFQKYAGSNSKNAESGTDMLQPNISHATVTDDIFPKDFESAAKFAVQGKAVRKMTVPEILKRMDDSGK
jgi:hypothetical protein